jgi:hypothetical protein
MASAREQLDVLSRAFLTRFFENEITAGTDDLTGSFFWLVAALAMPGLFIPWLMVFNWNFEAVVHGHDVLRIVSRADKAFYLGVSMLCAGGITTIVWTSLLPDRRDALVTGPLPVKAGVVVGAKLLALAAYVGIVAIGMHAAGSIFWGALLGSKGPRFFVLRGIAAHLLASGAITMWTCFAVAALQGVVLVVCGPRLFARASTVLQVVVVASLAVLMVWLPGMSLAASQTLRGGANAQPWTLAMPPIWFLGLYEWLLGTSEPLIWMLAGRAAAALAIAAAIAAATFPLAYRRLTAAAIEADGARGSALGRACRAALVWTSGRDSAVRAAAEFFVTTLRRVERQRFVLASAIGLSLAWMLPGSRAVAIAPAPQAPLLALPFAAMMFLLVGLRIASSLPADVRAAWVFDVHDLSRHDARQALERMMIALGVVPPVVLSTALFWYLWDGAFAIKHAVVSTAIAVLFVQMLIWRCDGMPCGQRWTPARLDLGRRWPLHLGLFLFVVGFVPRLEVAIASSSFWTAVVASALIVAAAVVRYASAHHAIVPSYDDVDPVAGVLRIN